jgi:cysteine desulfurase/selenocysteine lyase
LFEKSRALTIGLGKAIEYALNIGLDRIWQRITFLSGNLRMQLATIDKITVHDIGSQQCGIVTFSVSGIDSSFIKTELNAKNINISTGGASAT